MKNKTVTDMDDIVREIEKSGRKVKVPVERKKERQRLPKLTIVTHTNSYELQTDDDITYLYFSPETLLAGVLFRWCWAEGSGRFSLDEILRATAAAMDWADKQALLDEMDRLRAEVNTWARKYNELAAKVTNERRRIKTATSILNGNYSEFRTNLALMPPDDGPVEEEY